MRKVACSKKSFKKKNFKQSFSVLSLIKIKGEQTENLNGVSLETFYTHATKFSPL